MDNQPAIDMPAKYTIDALDGSDFAIDLWPPNYRFSMHLCYESDFELESEQCEALTVGVSRDVHLSFLDQYYCAFGGMGHYVRDKVTGQ
jgi:hypothetical protein